MKERPILFSGSMVSAILEGRKTQTRRILKMSQQYEGYIEGLGKPQFCEKTGEFTWFDSGTPIVSTKCKHGVPGERLWVRETWAPHCEIPSSAIYRCDRGGDYQDTVTPNFKWRPSIFMPRWASRITLEIEAVRVERLQEISEEDAVAEGIIAPRCELCGYTFADARFQMDHRLCEATEPPSATLAYRDLWESINGPGSWDLNPWVWVIQFRRVK